MKCKHCRKEIELNSLEEYVHSKTNLRKCAWNGFFRYLMFKWWEEAEPEEEGK